MVDEAAFPVVDVPIDDSRRLIDSVNWPPIAWRALGAFVVIATGGVGGRVLADKYGDWSQASEIDNNELQEIIIVNSIEDGAALQGLINADARAESAGLFSKFDGLEARDEGRMEEIDVEISEAITAAQSEIVELQDYTTEGTLGGIGLSVVLVVAAIVHGFKRRKQAPAFDNE